MASRKRKPPLPPKPFVKSALQLQQWAEYERLTALHDAEFKAKSDAVHTATVTKSDADDLLRMFDKWQQSKNIRLFVAETMAHIPPDASQPAIDAANQWQAWALGVADEINPAISQVTAFLSASEKENPAG